MINKLSEETDEVIEAITSGDRSAIKEELGDLFFTLLCLSRHLEECPEEILASANKKFESRYTIGIFSRLNYRDNKPNYLDDIPRTFNYIRNTLSKYSELSEVKRVFSEINLDNIYD